MVTVAQSPDPPRSSAVPLLLSLNAGYVDTAGFVTLQGLFTAHVTGNFVTLGAALVLGTSGVLAKLMALPVFCLTVFGARLAGHVLRERRLPAFAILLTAKLLLLIAAAVMAVALGPFTNGDSVAALATGMILVCAMSIQNAVHRVHLAWAPPSTLMTGNTTQIMLDLADLLTGRAGNQGSAMRARLAAMAAAVGVFALGCAAAALIAHWTGTWCFLVPPLIAAATLSLGAKFDHLPDPPRG